MPKVVRGRKLLVASVGIATISYACSSGTSGSGFPDANDASTDDVFVSSGNLGVPQDAGVPFDSGQAVDSGADLDAGADDAGDSGDAGHD